MKRRMTRRPARGGFTLLEVLIVLAIIGVIAAMAVPRLLGQQKQAQINSTKVAIKNLQQSVELYAVHHNATYPENISLLLQRGEDNSDPILDSEPKDSWGLPLYYDPIPKGNLSIPSIWSSGPDRKNDNGANDDINNWSDKIQ